VKITFSHLAERDLENIADWIAAENPKRALSFVAELKSECLNLSEFPARHPIFRFYQGLEIRRKVFGNYLIFYAVNDNTLAVVRVTHGAQDDSELMF
jgi:toxin ParE1/3/4